MIYEMIRSQMAKSVPFAHHAGVTLDKVEAGRAVATLPFRPEGLNHVGTQHAAALFAVGETASGGAMAGALAPMLAQIRPVASEARIRYLKAAKGTVRAEAAVADAAALLDALKAEGKVVFPVEVRLLDAEGGEPLGEMTVEWHVVDKDRKQAARA
ncbi:MAG TPA: DUF4442 domain-containing protein [Azospirillaceae bacterium]|nr:DUF4442 domain-containing protein [Azospirillaceae bacterium]